MDYPGDYQSTFRLTCQVTLEAPKEFYQGEEEFAEQNGGIFLFQTPLESLLRREVNLCTRANLARTTGRAVVNTTPSWRDCNALSRFMLRVLYSSYLAAYSSSLA